MTKNVQSTPLGLLDLAIIVVYVNTVKECLINI